jgi:hypothetical protein
MEMPYAATPRVLTWSTTMSFAISDRTRSAVTRCHALWLRCRGARANLRADARTPSLRIACVWNSRVEPPSDVPAGDAGIEVVRVRSTLVTRARSHPGSTSIRRSRSKARNDSSISSLRARSRAIERTRCSSTSLERTDDGYRIAVNTLVELVASRA